MRCPSVKGPNVPASRSRGRSSDGPRPHLGLPGRLAFELDALPLRLPEAEVFTITEGDGLMRELLAQFLRLGAQPVDHQMAHLDLAARGADVVGPAVVLLRERLGGLVAQRAWEGYALVLLMAPTVRGSWAAGEPYPGEIGTTVAQKRRSPRGAGLVGVQLATWLAGTQQEVCLRLVEADSWQGQFA